MIEMMEKRHQAYAKDARNRESKFTTSRQKWGSLCQRKDEKQHGLAEDVKLSAWWEAFHSVDRLGLVFELAQQNVDYMQGHPTIGSADALPPPHLDPYGWGIHIYMPGLGQTHGSGGRHGLQGAHARVLFYLQLRASLTRAQPFLTACITNQPQRDADEFVWAEMPNERFDAVEAKESQFRSPLHRLMHRIISTSITHRRGCKKVSRDDMFYMWALSDPSRFLNLPFTLAVF
ncbi:hypothetical protein L2E82_30238 [Cichorium intybus]|uniref:Uncharacterized protein n=1 Tax=Cichorium intybus TaxID=13427 RepID=A0ACB9D0F1_CICIN|nr:hypothetical protein L2E82_30238 [Cichorium intybus]